MLLSGTNNYDRQVRICHNTIVTGMADTWGYDVMINSYSDIQNAKYTLYIDSNVAEAHLVSTLHLLHAREVGCKVVMVDPRYTRMTAKSDKYTRIQSGTDIVLLFDVLYHIFKNGWKNKQYIRDRVYNMGKVRDEMLAKWTSDKVEGICGVPEVQVRKVAEMMAMNCPGTLMWRIGQA